jgi:hypothetical protein
VTTSPASTQAYIGTELELFAAADVGKSYMCRKIKHYPGRRVMEVGADIVGTTRSLCTGQAQKRLCRQPDPDLAAIVSQTIRNKGLPVCFRVIQGTLADIEAEEVFDTILCKDVFEHIEEDAADVKLGAGFLSRGGQLVALAFAYPWRHIPCGRAVGHFCRYAKRTMSVLTPHDLKLMRLIYLDLVGLQASRGNRCLLRQSLPTLRQIAVWDQRTVCVSRILAPLINHPAGKSVLGIWRRK